MVACRSQYLRNDRHCRIAQQLYRPDFAALIPPMRPLPGLDEAPVPRSLEMEGPIFGGEHRSSTRTRRALSTSMGWWRFQ